MDWAFSRVTEPKIDAIAKGVTVMFNNRIVESLTDTKSRNQLNSCGDIKYIAIRNMNILGAVRIDIYQS